jgi:hypothetical protein
MAEELANTMNEVLEVFLEPYKAGLASLLINQICARKRRSSWMKYRV